MAVRQLSFVASLLGLSLGSFYAIHRSVGIMAAIQGLIHAIIAVQGAKLSATDSVIGLLVSSQRSLLYLLSLIPHSASLLYYY